MSSERVNPISKLLWLAPDLQAELFMGSVKLHSPQSGTNSTPSFIEKLSQAFCWKFPRHAWRNIAEAQTYKDD